LYGCHFSSKTSFIPVTCMYAVLTMSTGPPAQDQ